LGIGTVCFRSAEDADFDGRYFIDNILVSDFFQITGKPEQSWGQVKAWYR
jgi:hypothetical protein